MAKQRIAVFFGGRAPEHDVSIVTGLQALNALRSDLFESFPVYVSPHGEWLVGDALRDKQTYIPGPETRRKLVGCRLGYSVENKGILVPERRGLFGGAPPIEFDVALLAFHGALGEDGCFQGILETAGVPYTGMRLPGSAIGMDKTMTKTFVEASTSAKQLPFICLRKTAGVHPRAPKLPADWRYPVIVKPAHMGSSIGVARADSDADVEAILRTIFLYDSKAMLEPYVAQRREYNIAVRRSGRIVETSAIEMPKSTAELLDFKEKYVRGDGPKKTGTSEGMLSLTRDINPALEPGVENDIRRWAAEIYEALDGTGSPRLDFIVDTQTGDLWFNEINPCPGSFAHFLWEAAANKLLFSELLEHLIEEAIAQRNLTDIPIDPVPNDARLFPRR